MTKEYKAARQLVGQPQPYTLCSCILDS